MKIKVSNDFQEHITLMLEPWGEDYEMNPDDVFEIISEQHEANAYFHTVFHKNHISVFAEGMDHAEVYQNGTLIHCGHNRPEK